MQTESIVKPDRQMVKLFAKCNLAIVLADVADSLMMEFDAESRIVGKCLRHEQKMRFNMMNQSGKDFKIRTRDVAKTGYRISDADNFCKDSDWLRDILMLIVDRVGDNDEKMLKLRAAIFNMKSEMEIY
jgi:hypothetical protein